MKTQAQLVADWNASHIEGTEICLGGLAANHLISTCSPAFLGEDNLAYVNVAIEGVCETKWLVSEIAVKEEKEIDDAMLESRITSKDSTTSTK